MAQRTAPRNTPSPGARLEPVFRASTVDMIAERIREAILDGTLPPGAPLGEADMAHQLGVSRGPLREGMQRLAQEGLLGTVRRRGLAVVTMTPEDVSDVYLMRAAVERAAARQLLRSDPRHIKQTVKLLTTEQRKMSRAALRGSARLLSDSYLIFHRTLVDAAGSQRLSRSIRTLLVETRLCTFSIHGSFKVRAGLPESHEQLVQALAERDDPKVAALLETHMLEAVEWLTAPPKSVEDLETFAAPTPDSPQPLDRLELPEGI
ncbi:GntR family transcriptional regulator [Stackebrandtia nassauensis]|uniref:Transcriptional regulator, GntR family n=1 Tax=Stackebrandtia nassauensis (strain DSM 44728 / CIP 108903 / NRRL B-16338 / NBRC 102104 / LLR-40K-21) TaxID=446470 RepID=D3Q6K2_STANL|nr:GntR family transcriptional regulator [Stackebrandtia nassauensis]ADD44245.1 transcriptional regulator, GntR family [Stackebrandtia nassauensis DSM 44728]